MKLTGYEPSGVRKEPLSVRTPNNLPIESFSFGTPSAARNGGGLLYTPKPGRGSNGEDRRERDVFKRTGSPRPESKWPFAGGQEASPWGAFRGIQTDGTHEPVQSYKTGYARAEDSRQVPRPTHFPPDDGPMAAGRRMMDLAGGILSLAVELVNGQRRTRRRTFCGHYFSSPRVRDGSGFPKAARHATDTRPRGEDFIL